MKPDKLQYCMDPSARKIHDALQTVFELRQRHDADPALAQASAEVKRFQARRFQATYPDLLHSPRYQSATAFFLHELYSDKDYTERDQQFSRIASTIARLFPQAVVNTAAALAEVHALTETLDDLMAQRWRAEQSANPQGSECARYVHCWRTAGDAAGRHRQLAVVLQLGQSLNRLTRAPGLRTLLRMMRRPAASAGLTAFQHFLETGFDAFAEMRGSDEFLKLVRERELGWIRLLFEGGTVTCETQLSHLLAASPS